MGSWEYHALGKTSKHMDAPHALSTKSLLGKTRYRVTLPFLEPDDWFQHLRYTLQPPSPPTHTHTHTKRTNVRSSPNGDMPPPDQLRLGPLCATSRNTGPSARQTPEARPSTRRSTDYAPPLWCGHPKSHLYLSGIRHSQWSCPSLA